MVETDILILGGGVAGLACRAALQPPEREVVLLESSDSIGGLLRVYQHGPFIFDTVPHVIFFRSQQLLRALSRILPTGLREFRRRHAIWQKGRVIPYPYQFNSCHLEAGVKDECLTGFVSNPYYHSPNDNATFEQWLLYQFGPGFYRHFFKPYNEKLYRIPLADLEAAPMQWTIPADSRDAIISGAKKPHEMPGQPVFYPLGPNGIASIPMALKNLGKGEILCGCKVVSIDHKVRQVETDTGLKLKYRHLISSVPLPVLIDTLKDPPDTIIAARNSLRAVDITVLRIGVEHSGGGLPYMWTYFPDSDVPFYRLTRLEYIGTEFCPHGGASLLVEVSGSSMPEEKQILELLNTFGVICQIKADHYSSLYIPYAYVLFSNTTRQVVANIKSYLNVHNIIPIGRYGDWSYGDIELAIESGLNSARSVVKPNRPLWENMKIFRS